MTIPARLVRAALLVKGFQVSETHHELYWFCIGSKKTSIRTRISHSEKELDDYLLGLVATQMGLTKKQLLSFIDCTLSGQQYLELLYESGTLKRPPAPAKPRELPAPRRKRK